LGSACLELDANANIISYEEYHPFGTTSYRAGRSYAEVSQKRYKYCGKERDEETGLYYYGARYYAGWLCRFVSVDPLQHEYPYYTPYQYAGNKPITYVDLDGLEEILPNEKRPAVINEQAQNRINKLIDKDSPDYSHEFVEKYEELINSDIVFNIYEVEADGNQLDGRIGKVAYNQENNAYEIFYMVNTGSRISPEGGFSAEYATLFEELYHAWDIMKGNMDYNRPTATDEARAWQFAATAPGTNMTVTTTVDGIEYTDFTVAHTIKSNQTEDVAKWFVEGNKGWIDKRGIGHNMINAIKRNSSGEIQGLYHYLPLK
jgi:RHS repeat-associated protein